MSRLPALLIALLCPACTPWDQISGPTVGAGVVYQPDRGVSPEVDAGYAFDRFEGWYGWAADASVGWEPWRNRVSATALLRGEFLFWEFGIGPTASWSPDGFTYGLAFTTSVHASLGTKSTCSMNKRDDDGGRCLSDEDTVYPNYLPRAGFTGSIMSDDTERLHFGGDLILSTYFLRHGERRPNNER